MSSWGTSHEASFVGTSGVRYRGISVSTRGADPKRPPRLFPVPSPPRSEFVGTTFILKVDKTTEMEGRKVLPPAVI